MMMNIILIIILTVVAGIGGYTLMHHAIKPVEKIADTAKEISESRDMSRRIDLSDEDVYKNISNSYAYGKENGTIKVTLAESGGRVVVSIEDDGIGISKENLPHIWERFYQVDPARTSNEDGNMGLGLSMVKWIADSHGGEFSAESELGKGTIITFAMPKEGQE